MKEKKDIYEILEGIMRIKTIDAILFSLKNEKTTQAKLVDFLMRNYNIKRSTAYELIGNLRDNNIMIIEHGKHNEYLIKIPKNIKKLILEIIKTIGKYRVEMTPTKIKKIYQGPEITYIIETKRTIREKRPYILLEPE